MALLMDPAESVGGVIVTVDAKSTRFFGTVYDISVNLKVETYHGRSARACMLVSETTFVLVPFRNPELFGLEIGQVKNKRRLTNRPFTPSRIRASLCT
jgi:hypothetical protein